MHGAEILDAVGGVVDGVDQAGDVLFVGVGDIEGIAGGFIAVRWFVDGFEADGKTVVLHVLDEEHGVVAFFLCLDIIPVGETVEILVGVPVGDVEIELGAVKFFVDLLIEKLCNFLVHRNLPFLKLVNCSKYKKGRRIPLPDWW